MTDERVSIPLVMLPGNIDVLLKHIMPCQGVSMIRDPDTENAVILVFHGPDKEAAKKLGFKFGDGRTIERALKE